MLKQASPICSKPHYRGRFAPTPSGPLHFGSLVAALGSYLDAKAHKGDWLVRIEDVDKPRAIDGAADIILHQLAAHGLHWDDSVIYQSQRDQRYQAIIDQLGDDLYRCNCTRRAIKARGEHYDGHCRRLPPQQGPYAIRFKNDDPVTVFDDRWHGPINGADDSVREDFVVRRRDQLFAYQLAVVVDDIDQQISHIVRGSDLIQPSFWQLTLWQHLAEHKPIMMHLPLMLDDHGLKLSKQNHAPAINNNQPLDNLKKAAQALQLLPPNTDTVSDFLKEATELWRKKWRITPD